MQMRSMNPVLKEESFLKQRGAAAGELMTLEGTIHKSITAIALVFVSAIGTWSFLGPQLMAYAMPVSIGGGLIGLGLVIAGSFKPTWAGFVTPAYAVVEGAVLATISMIMEQSYPGIAFQAVILTFAVLFTMLLVYRMKWIRVTDKFRKILYIGLGAVFFTYLISFVMGFFGTTIPYIHGSGPIGIGFSLIVVGLASFFLLIDFDNIEKGVQMGAPKHMEWYSALGLLVTLIWLYIEILKLLAKLNSRR